MRHARYKVRTDSLPENVQEVAKRLEKEGVGLDLGAYRDAPAGLRIWCGGTVETSDIEALLPWIEYAFMAEIEAQTETA